MIPQECQELAVEEQMRSRKRHCANFREWLTRADQAYEAQAFILSAHLYEMAAYENEQGGGTCAERKTEIRLTGVAEQAKSLEQQRIGRKAEVPNGQGETTVSENTRSRRCG